MLPFFFSGEAVFFECLVFSLSFYFCSSSSIIIAYQCSICLCVFHNFFVLLNPCIPFHHFYLFRNQMAYIQLHHIRTLHNIAYHTSRSFSLIPIVFIFTVRKKSSTILSPLAFGIVYLFNSSTTHTPISNERARAQKNYLFRSVRSLCVQQQRNRIHNSMNSKQKRERRILCIIYI